MNRDFEICAQKKCKKEHKLMTESLQEVNMLVKKDIQQMLKDKKPDADIKKHILKVFTELVDSEINKAQTICTIKNCNKEFVSFMKVMKPELNKAKKMVLKSKNTEFKLLFNGMLGLLDKSLKKRKELEKSLKKSI
jgi:hypothetical protein